MRARIEIECKDPKMVIESLKPDMDAKKFDIELLEQESTLVMTVVSKDVPGLLAGVNSYLRLIKTAINVEEI